MKRNRQQVDCSLIPDLLKIVCQYFGTPCQVSFPNNHELKPLQCWITCAWPNFYECHFFTSFPVHHEDFIFQTCQLVDFQLDKQLRFTIQKETKEIICVWGSSILTEYEKLCGYRSSTKCLRLFRSPLAKLYQACDVDDENCCSKVSGDDGNRVREWKIIYGLPVNTCRRHCFGFEKLCFRCRKWIAYSGAEVPFRRKLVYCEKNIFKDSLQPGNPIWICHLCICNFKQLTKEEYGNGKCPRLLQMNDN